MRKIIDETITNCTLEQTMMLTIQPGDLTKYTFAITRVRYNKDYVIISEVGCSGMAFTSYEYSIDQIMMFFKTYGTPKNKETYSKWAEPLLKVDMAGYVTEHSSCNPWTAIAAMLAIYITEVGI